MKRKTISDLGHEIGKKIKIKGWTETIRKQSKHIFIVLRDTTGKVQIIVSCEKKSTFKIAQGLTKESVICVKGTVMKQAQAFGGYEIQAEEIEILSIAHPQLPIPVVEKDGTKVDLKKRLDHRWIDLRKPRSYLIFQIYTDLQQYMRDFFRERKFIEAATPKLMASPSESKAELFKIKYFKRKGYLAQSGQFYKQLAMAAGFERFYTFGDTYRADPSSTIWHVAQFVTLDVEISYIESPEEVYELEEDLIIHSITQLKKEYGKRIKEAFGVEIEIPSKPFVRIPMAKAKKKALELGSNDTGADLTTPEEKLVGQWVHEKHGHDFVFITKFPWEVRPFYHMKWKDGTTRSADLIYKGREMSTDAQREHRYEVLIDQVQQKGLVQTELQHYLDFFKYGCPPHGGFGFGYERFIMQLLELPNIREAIFLPRDMKRLSP